ncbi:major facilitator superfamily domain-containing protein [Syncephalastrum racemosum]|uniref:Major facilitator superfamily domain-containing protein n=1 Tax=Syncephalastrum racemosum TaxID=13706 RepID=A0A1X2HRD1_SYNRA|nr:major facilitator superfamily domain-containing protein [Syncephalastrum racemosum]
MQPTLDDAETEKGDYISNEAKRASSSTADGQISSFSAVEEKRLLRRIDTIVLPLLCTVAFLQYLDKIMISFTTVLGIYDDTGITQNQFGWIGSILFIGQIVFQIFNSYLMPVLPTSKYLGVVVCAWGIILACTSLGMTFPALLVLRLILGFTEGPGWPLCYNLIASLYRRREHVVRIGWFQNAISVSTTLSGLISYGIGHMDGIAGLRAWRWCMIIPGIFTFLWGLVIFIFLPDHAKSRWFALKPEEIVIVEDRLRDNAVVIQRKMIWWQVFEGLRDPKLYAYFFLAVFVGIPIVAVNTFRAQIISQMGFADLDSLLLSMPVGVTNFTTTSIAMYLSYRFNEISLVGVLTSTIAFLGSLLLAVLPSNGSRLAGLYLTNNLGGVLLMQTYIANNVAGVTKKALYTNVNMLGFSVGSFVGPLLVRGENAPRYIPALITFMVTQGLAALVFLYLRWSYKRENERRQDYLNAHPNEGLQENEKITGYEDDMTDKQNIRFIYRL